ncbi:hypothetical protein NQ318_010235 [Aromia moschata]|uniref:DUF4817 domain-containing protein n=1 Tax=Aromia moschata TaxID=1265417 RepID=A0AAV8YHS3_9CUCU|nr:hypothetical protein NQ318_010235 [Aromia moschata]
MIGYGDRARTQCEVVRLFRETHPDLSPLNQGTISKIEAQYREMGHVRKVPSKRQAVDDDTKFNLLLALEENPITPARQLARDISSTLFYPQGIGLLCTQSVFKTRHGAGAISTMNYEVWLLNNRTDAATSVLQACRDRFEQNCVWRYFPHPELSGQARESLSLAKGLDIFIDELIEVNAFNKRNISDKFVLDTRNLTIPSPMLWMMHGISAVDPVCDVTTVLFSVAKCIGTFSKGGNEAPSSFSSPLSSAMSRETGDVKDLPKSGRPKITQDKEIDIVISTEENPQNSSTLVASENEDSQTTVLRILRKENYHPYKFQLVWYMKE